jgi:hypothetical protein
MSEVGYIAGYHGNDQDSFFVGRLGGISEDVIFELSSLVFLFSDIPGLDLFAGVRRVASIKRNVRLEQSNSILDAFHICQFLFDSSVPKFFVE